MLQLEGVLREGVEEATLRDPWVEPPEAPAAAALP